MQQSPETPFFQSPETPEILYFASAITTMVVLLTPGLRFVPSHRGGHFELIVEGDNVTSQKRAMKIVLHDTFKWTGLSHIILTNTCIITLRLTVKFVGDEKLNKKNTHNTSF